MKNALWIIVTLVLGLSLISVPAFAEQAELSLKYWYAGVGGADQWVADYSVYDVQSGSVTVHIPVDSTYDKTLMLQPGIGGAFILLGEHPISPSVSVGMSYWGLSRANEVGMELTYQPNGTEESLGTFYVIKVPFQEEHILAGPDTHWDEAAVLGKGSLSMSALDVYAMRTFSESGWEVNLSAGIRRAVFNQSLSTTLEISSDEYGYEYYSYALGSKLDVSGIGPQVGVAGSYSLTDEMTLKAGARAGFLFGTANADATWDYERETSLFSIQQLPDESLEKSTTSSVRINTYDMNVALAYQIAEQWSVEAGYYASIWKSIPSPCVFNYNRSVWDSYPIEDLLGDEWTWDQSKPRDIIVRGLTLGVNFKF